MRVTGQRASDNLSNAGDRVDNPLILTLSCIRVRKRLETSEEGADEL
jgi:hypothetical protein